MTRIRATDLFSLHLIPKNSLDHLGISLVPSIEILNRERHLDMSKLRARLVERIVGARVKMKLNESILCLITPQVLHERIDHLSLCGSDVFVDHNCRMLAED